jgi:putative spermidine/putrescine transport system permease protein
VSARRRLSTFLFAWPRVTLAIALAPPLLWLGVVYVGSLAALLVQSFFTLDDYTGQVVRELTLSTYERLFTAAHVDIVLRTAGMAAAVTLASAMLGFPVAYLAARHAQGRMKALFYLGVLLPLWSSYLVRLYAWKLILAKEGVATWFIERMGLLGALEAVLELPVVGGPSLSASYLGMFVVFVYMWLPYMVLPIQASLERVPPNLLEASGDLGARPAATFRHVTWPLAFPGVVAGSIFTFSLTLGDYIIPGTIGQSSLFIGQAVVLQQGTAGNIPLAAAFSMVPIVVMGAYLTVAKRLGAFHAL